MKISLTLTCSWDDPITGAGGHDVFCSDGGVAYGNYMKKLKSL